MAAAYAKGELSASVREQVRRHIAWCPQCGPKFRAMGLAT
ncbi:MAG: zf-HC2 domain-containing protein [Gemmataceae bacterium]|nr:zf-HC2 domain-containing protein [Gemmataceae bacterium]